MNLIFLSLEASWTWLAAGYFVAVFVLALLLAALFRAGECSSGELSFGKIYLIVAQQLMTGPAFVETTDLEINSLPLFFFRPLFSQWLCASL